MANGKIISFVDHQINAALDPMTDELEDQRVVTLRNIAVLTDHVRNTRLGLTNAIADNTLTLRHDINHLAAAVNALRTDINAMSAVQTHQRDETKVLKNLTWETRHALNQLRQELDQLKQGGKVRE